MARGLRGLEERHEQDNSLLVRDTRTWEQRAADFFKSSTAMAITLATIGGACFFVPGLADVFGVLGIILYVISITRKSTLPFRLPMRSGLDDWGNLISGTRKPKKADGIYFFGNDRKTNEELWFSNTDMRTHVLIFGSTGSGKTETMISVAYNAFLQSSGLIYVDGKGDNSLFAKIFSMCRFMGREDDLLLINFMTGARDIIGPQKKRLSNTLNPFAKGSSSMLSNLVVSLMDSSSQSSDGDMWKGRAIAFVEALMKILVAMRDAGHILLDANTIRNYFHLEKLEPMMLDKVFLRDNQEPISLEGYPDNVLEPLTNYMLTLPGFNREKKGKQVSQVREQHGFITMQLVRVFTSLADTYGHILRTQLAEVDLHDVVLNRRILIALLPALEKSPDELANLGKIIIATLKAMMAAGLGEAVEGEYSDLITRKPTNAETPFLCILDEYGYYAVQGFAVVPAQARSLGFSVVFAGQDLPAFQKASKEEAASIGANTNIKICMKLEDPMETWEFFSKTAGEAYVTQTSGFQSDMRSVTNAYRDTQGAQLEKRARVDLLDLKEQREGEGHMFFKSKIVRFRSFYADPKPVKAMRLNQFLKINEIPEEEFRKIALSFQHFESDFKADNLFEAQPESSSDIDSMVELFKEQTEESAIERGVSALLAYHDKSAPDEEDEFEELGAVSEDRITAFAPLYLSDYLKENLLLEGEELEYFTRPLLRRKHAKEQMAFIERFIGKSEEHSQMIADELLSDVTTATDYPPEVHDIPSVDELAQDVRELIEHITFRKEEGADGGIDETDID